MDTQSILWCHGDHACDIVCTIIHAHTSRVKLHGRDCQYSHSSGTCGLRINRSVLVQVYWSNIHVHEMK